MNLANLTQNGPYERYIRVVKGPSQGILYAIRGTYTSAKAYITVLHTLALYA